MKRKNLEQNSSEAKRFRSEPTINKLPVKLMRKIMLKTLENSPRGSCSCNQNFFNESTIQCSHKEAENDLINLANSCRRWKQFVYEDYIFHTFNATIEKLAAMNKFPVVQKFHATAVTLDRNHNHRMIQRELKNYGTKFEFEKLMLNVTQGFERKFRGNMAKKLLKIKKVKHPIFIIKFN